MRIKVHPLFFALALLLVAFGQALAFVWTFTALVFHELGHAAAARVRGFRVNQLTLFPFGAMMSVNERFDRTSGLFIGLAGPAVNAVLALITLGVWWLAPSLYPYTEHFLYANVSLALFNLLPVYPLDGSRAVLSVAKNKLKAVKGMQLAGIAVSIVFLALFILSAFYQINFTSGIIAVFLFFAAAFGTNEEAYMSVLDSSSKNYLLGVENKTVKISRYTPIIRLFHHIKPTYDTFFLIVDDGGEKLKGLTETELKKIASENKMSECVGKAAGLAGNYEKFYSSVNKNSKSEFIMKFSKRRFPKMFKQKTGIYKPSNNRVQNR